MFKSSESCYYNEIVNVLYIVKSKSKVCHVDSGVNPC